MNEAVMRERILELADTVSSSPLTTDKAPSAEGIYLPHKPAPKPTADEALDHLRLQVKYLLFDLEATRRENRYLRQMLEGRSKSDNDSKPGA